MAKSSGPFIVLFGDEDFLQDRFIEARCDTWRKRREIVRLDGSRISEVDLVNACEWHSDEHPARAVILDNAQDLKLDKLLKEYIANKDPEDMSSLLLAVLRSESLGAKQNAAVWTEAIKKGQQVSYFKLKPWETEKILARITDEAEVHKLKLDKGVPELFQRLLEDDLRTTANEMKKLTHLVGEDRLVKKEHAVLVLAPKVSVEPKDIAEAAFGKDRKAALNNLSRIFRNVGDSACVSVVSSCLYQVEKLLIVRQMLDKGDSLNTIAERIGTHPFRCKIHLIPLAQKHTVKALLGHMNNLCRLEAQVKGSARSKRTLVELAVLAIAA